MRAKIRTLKRLVRLAWSRTSPFHGGNTGSNPVRDAKILQGQFRSSFPSLKYTPMGFEQGSFIYWVVRRTPCRTRRHLFA